MRTSILSKYLSARKGARGWGLFLRRTRTSLRPEIYWRGDAGGDFYTFERFQILPNRVYTLTLIAELNNYITLFIQSESPVTAKAGRPAPVFLGGYSVSDAGDLTNLGSLLRGSDRQDDNRLIGSLQSFLIAAPKTVPRGREEKLKFVDGGPAALAAKFQAGEVALFEPPAATARP